MRGLVVTGTDTGVGKTVVAAGIAQALGARYWKPVQAGIDEETDSQCVARLAPGATVLPEAFRLATPCSPHEAARIDGVTIAPGALALPPGDGPLVVEGAGGVLVPFAPDLLAADLFALWGLPVALVARTSLGTISHSLLSLEALRSRGLEVAGVVFSGDENAASEAAIVRFGQCRHLGRLPRLAPLNAATLADAVRANLRIDLLA
ncbi:dethiobiotin synthase [Novosphingobium lentum]|uniref:dethiobiotin synthase n=1 Tax=Novosphingobium lentum TaxID=145287 RepID=UPI00082D8EA7|nr:dethiobiotin synthase [Novosphingobium lentum]